MTSTQTKNKKKRDTATIYPFSRHASLFNKTSTSTEFDMWLGEHNRRNLSVPDLQKLKKEWDEYQQSDMTPDNKIKDKKLQIDLLNIRLYNKIKKPQMRLKMGPAQYYSNRSNSVTGDWNEGFVFHINYHAQLFNTIEFDLYEKPHRHWPTTRHVGKAKLKISTLAGKSDVFVTFLPIYEYRTQHLLPSEIQSTLLETELIDRNRLSSKIGDLNLIGSVQIRVRYHFQRPMKLLHGMLNRRKSHHSHTHPLSRSSSSSSSNSHNVEYTQQEHHNTLLSPPTSPTDKEKEHMAPLTTTSTRRSSCYNRGDLAKNEYYIDNLFKSRLASTLAATIPDRTSSEQSFASFPTSSSASSASASSSSLVRQFKKGLYLHHNNKSTPIRTKSAPSATTKRRHQKKRNFIFNLILPSKKLPNSSSGKRYGFSQTDSDDTRRFNPDDDSSATTTESSDSTSNNDSTTTLEEPPSSASPTMSSTSTATPDSTPPAADFSDRLAHGARKKAHHIIKSVNFGDRNFASLWMQDSFEDVALSHPLVDKLIGLVVSKQTQAMVRALIKTASAFGQGFRITGLQLLKAALILQKFYTTVPVDTPKPLIGDLDLIENACHYFSFALVAYGWRGLCYLGAYGQFVLRGITDRRSNRLAIIRFLRIDPQDLLGYEYALRKGASLQSSYYVAIDRPKHALVLAIRGTWSLYDAITDLVCEYMPFTGGLVHSGMLASAQWFYTSIIPQIIRYLRDHQNLTSLIITGHSLGGGVASLLTMMVADQISTLREVTNNNQFHLHCYNYAPAAVSSSSLCKKYEPYITSFVVQDDVVGKMSYGSAMKLKELVMDTISAYETLGGFKTTVTDQKAQKVCFDILSQRRNKVMEKADIMFPSLYIPGRIIHIQRGDKKHLAGGLHHHHTDTEEEEQAPLEKVLSKSPGTTKIGYTLHDATYEISNEMRLSKTCIEDHLISAYQNAFVAIREQYLSSK